MRDLTLPEGLTSRALTMDDAKAVYEVAAAQEQHDIGRIEIEPADIVSDWSRPSWDVATHTVGVFDGDRMVAYGEITSHDRGDAAVHPDYRRRGIGTAVAGWLQQTARDLGGAGYGTPVPQGSPGDHLLETLGYRIRHTSWVLALPEGKQIEHRDLPEHLPRAHGSQGLAVAAHRHFTLDHEVGRVGLVAFGENRRHL